MTFKVETPLPRTQPSKSSPPAATLLDDLQARLAAAATALDHAAESIETHGIKLLLKAYAQQRTLFGRELRAALTQGGDAKPEAPAMHSALEEGARDIAASLTVAREGRRPVALSAIVEGEGTLLRAYTQALQADLPVALRDLLERHRNQIAAGYDRLVELSGAGVTEPVTRVFEDARAADEALARLDRAGFPLQAIDVFDVDQMPVRRSNPARVRRSIGSTILAGAAIGALVGGLAGLAWALYQSSLPGMALTISVPPWQLVVSALVAGAFGGAVFGWIIGRNKVEDDRFVYTESLVNGTRLVVVYAEPERRAEAQRILQVYHDRELRKE